MMTTDLFHTIVYGGISAALVTGCYLGFKLYERRNRAAMLQTRTVRHLNFRLVR